jgi:hypothetical protein
MKISEAFGDGSRERESAKDDGAEIFHRRLSLSVSRQMPVSFERSCCVPPGSFCLRSVCLLARTCSLLEGHERGSGGWKKMKKGKREVSFLDLQRCQRRGEKWKEKKSTLLSFKLKNQKNVFPSASLPLRGARRGGLCPAGTCSLSLSLSLIRGASTCMSASPPCARFTELSHGPSFPTDAKRRVLSNALTKVSLSLFLFENPPIKQADPVRQQQQLVLPGAVLAPELALEEEGPATHAQAW